MLREDWLNRAALGLAVVGLVMLFYYSTIAEPRPAKVEGLSKKNTGEFVQAEGRVEEVKKGKNCLFFELNDGEKIAVVKFNPLPEEIVFAKEGSFVKVVGKVGYYKGRLEIIAERVENV